MKKILLLLCAFTLVTACENEPIDSELSGNTGGNNSGGNTSEEPLALASYSFDTDTSIPFFGDIILDNDYNFNSDNLLHSVDSYSQSFGLEFITYTEFTRDNNNNLTVSNTYYLGELSDVTTITYNASNQITQISYNDIESDDEDYTYNYTYDGNVVTKTEVGSDIVTLYTFNSSNQLTRKESFINDTSIQLEVLTYDSTGNVITSTMTGETNVTSTYLYDSNENPLVEPFQARDYFNSLGDEYDDQAGNSYSHFASTNNWIGVITDGTEYNFTVTYDNENRILTRSGSYSEDEVSVTQEETFTYVN